MAPPTSKRPSRPASSRPKPQLSCQACRTKKLKCDRGQPCSNCAKDAQRECRYLARGALYTRIPKSTRNEDRIEALEQRLEQVVAALHDAPRQRGIGSQDDPGAPRLASINDDVALHHDAQGHNERFISANHWEGVLNDIADIRKEVFMTRRSLSGASSSPTEYGDDLCPRLLFSGHRDISVDELCLPIVSRPAAETLLDLIVDNAHARWVLLLVHGPTFRKEVAAYWKNPTGTDLAWLAVFYAVLSITSYIVSRSAIVIDDLPAPERVSYLCLTRAAQCLRNSDYARPSTYTVTAMILSLACEHNWTRDSHFRASLMLGITVRLALRMGYHRDPSLYPGMTIFQGEIRRRVWTFLKQLDQLIAQKCGLPRFIDDRKTDTGLPCNVSDEDLHPDMQVLPPACPEDQATAVATLILKSRVLAIHGRIMDQGHNIQPMTYSEVTEIEEELTAEVKKKPLWLEVDPLMGANHTALDEMNGQIEVDLIVQSARMALHRKYLVLAHTDPQYAASRRACLDAAQRSLYLQRLLSEASDTQGKDSKSNWRFVSLVGHDFLHAALLICLDIDQSLRSQRWPTSSRHAPTSREERIEQMRSIRTAQQIWSKNSEHHGSGREAAVILDMLLKRFASPLNFPDQSEFQNDASEVQQTATNEFLSDTTPIPGMSDLLNMEATNCPPSMSPNMSFDLTSVDLSQTRELQDQAFWPPDVPDSSFAQIQSMLNDSQIDLDWNAWNSDLYSADVYGNFSTSWP